MAGAEPGRERDAPTRRAFRLSYETLRSLLHRNGTALQWMADLQTDLNYRDVSDPSIRRRVERLLDETLLAAQELNLLADDGHRALYDVVEGLRREVRVAVRPADAPDAEQPLVVRLDEDGALDARLAGGKAAGLAALRRHFPEQVPAGFVATTAAYRRLVEENGLFDRIRLLTADLDAVSDRRRLAGRSEAVREIVRRARVPEPVRRAIAAHAERLGASRWAVRSSALAEDDRFSFAGQFDSRLGVPTAALEEAYLFVLASRFSERALLYRFHCGLRDVDTPMAVLIMPMIEPVAAGVIYTRDPSAAGTDRMLVNAVPGIADRMVRGEQPGDFVALARGADPRPEDPGDGAGGKTSRPAYLPEDALARLGALAFRAAETIGYDMDVEWALDGIGRLWLLQGRRLVLATPEEDRRRRGRSVVPLLEGGRTLFPGRAEGPVERARPGPSPRLRSEAPVLVVDQPTPELAAVLPGVAALLIERGSAVGHLATVIREFAIPTLYQLGAPVWLLREGEFVSVNATTRRVHRGSRWVGTRRRVLSRVTAAAGPPGRSPLYDTVLALNLTDATASGFKAAKCRSVHDVVRFVHEMAVRQMFRIGDRQSRFWRGGTRRIDTPLPVRLRLLDLDGCAGDDERRVDPERVASVPFRALWRGVKDAHVTWRARPIPGAGLVPPGILEQVLGGTAGPRRAGKDNYLVVAGDYLNLNARFAYHYATVDALVGPGAQGNHVHFRLRGGAAAEEGRFRRARFLELVLGRLHFGVDRRGDLVTAWLRNATRAESETALEALGRLMACARQLDMFLADDDTVRRYADRFIGGEYAAFG